MPKTIFFFFSYLFFTLSEIGHFSSCLFNYNKDNTYIIIGIIIYNIWKGWKIYTRFLLVFSNTFSSNSSKTKLRAV